MTTIQEDKLSMYYVVKNTCEKYQTTWTANAVFAATYNLWAAKIPLIEQNRDAQLLETTGITTDKTTKRNSMTDKALFMINRMQSYANVVTNPELLENIKYSASDLKKKRDSDVIGICNIVTAKANANVTALATYGVTAAMITELQAAITAYMAVLAKPKVAKSQTKTATENLAKLFKEADDILNQRLDLDIELFKATKPEFYSQYKTARMIVSLGGTPVSVLGSVIATGSGEPLKGVVFTFVPENNALMKAAGHEKVKPIVKKSADKGKFRASLIENSYRVTIEKLGFKKQELMITVVNGETTFLDIELERD